MDSIQPKVVTPTFTGAKSVAGDKPATITDSFSQERVPDAGLMKAVNFRTDVRVDSLRHMTADEKADFKSWFPALNVDKAMVSAEATPVYNCIAWTTGNTKSWDWPPSMFPMDDPRDAFKKYYTERGFSPISEADAAKVGKDKELVGYWEDPNGPTHGSVHGPSHGDTWESKCGQAARIRHDRDELVSDVYGSIKGYWLKTGPSTVVPQTLNTSLIAMIKEKLGLRLETVNPEVKAKFNEAYDQWQNYQRSPQVSMSSDPAAYCKGEGFDKIVKLGPEALPLLIEKSMDGDHFSQYAIEKVTHREGTFKSSGPAAGELKPERVNCSEQEKADQVMVQWLNSNY